MVGEQHMKRRKVNDLQSLLSKEYIAKKTQKEVQAGRSEYPFLPAEQCQGKQYFLSPVFILSSFLSFFFFFI
jgi:hypothetical protein